MVLRVRFHALFKIGSGFVCTRWNGKSW